MNKGYSKLIKEDKKYGIYLLQGEDGVYNSVLIDEVDSLEQAEDRVAELRAETGSDAYYKEINESEELNEEATQAAAVDGGIVSVFGSNGGNKFDEDNWYKQLFELNDIEETTIEDQYKVASSKVENTGGGTLVEFGRFENGLYYGLNEETLAIYDADYYIAYMNQEEEDLYDWQAKHLINIFAADDMEYDIVANQSKEFKKQIIDEE